MDRTKRLLSDFSERDSMRKDWLAGVPVCPVQPPRTRADDYEARRNLIPADVTAFPERSPPHSSSASIYRRLETGGKPQYLDHFFDRPVFYAQQEAAMLSPRHGQPLNTKSADAAAVDAWKNGLEHFQQAQPQFTAAQRASTATELQRWMQGGASGRVGHGRTVNSETGDGLRSSCDTLMAVRKGSSEFALAGGGAECNRSLTAARSEFEKAARMHPMNYTYARAKTAACLQEPLRNRAAMLKHAVDCSQQAVELAVLPCRVRPRPSVHI